MDERHPTVEGRQSNTPQAEYNPTDNAHFYTSVCKVATTQQYNLATVDFWFYLTLVLLTGIRHEACVNPDRPAMV